MYIKDAEITDFRNIERLKASFNPKFNIFFGKNAQGKTNLLEALSLSLNGASHREKTNRNFIRNERPSAFLKLNVADAQEIVTTLTLSIDDRRTYRINGSPVKKRSELMASYNVVLFTPEDLRIIKGSPSDRRNFLNESISYIYPAYHEAVRNYNRTLKQRNSLLRDYSKASVADGMLDIYDETLARLGSGIAVQRIGALKKMEALTDSLNSQVSQGEKIRFFYSSNVIDSSEDLPAIEKQYLDRLKKSRKEDIFRKRTSVGVHHDDINIFLNGQDTKKFASQGQQRSIALCMKLSVIKLLREKFGEWPIVLLDDVMSDLDSFRQKQIIGLLENCQSFITCVDTSFADDGLECSIYEINNGHLIGKSEVNSGRTE